MTALELFELVQALCLPDNIKTNGRYKFTAIEALCLTCAHLRSAGDIYDLVSKFDHSASAISEIVNWVVVVVVDDEKWGHLLDFDREHLLSRPNLEKYVSTVHEGGAPLMGAWGFIDCTIWQICRLSHWQRQAYNSYKKYHTLKFQAVMLPNGMFGHLYGPIEGQHNDSFLLLESELMASCEEYAVCDGMDKHTPMEDHYLQLFNDATYGVSPQMISPFSGPGNRTEEEQQFNAAMGAVHIEVKHGFGIVTNTWPALNAHWKMHIFSSPIGTQYRTVI